MTEARHICASLAEAFAPDPFYRAVTVDVGNDEPARHAMLTEYFRLALDEARDVGELRLSGSDGAALWLTNEYSQADVNAASKRRTLALSNLLGKRGFQNYEDISAEMLRKLPGSFEGAWYLSILGVRAQARGRGLAQQLLGPTLERADRLDARCYLETFNPLSLPFYRRLGFAEEVELWEPVTSQRYWLLSR